MSELHYFRPDWIEPTDRTIDCDLCVYGASSSGIITAIAAKKLGLTVALLQPGRFVGGLTTGGLGETDYGKQHVIGGMAREFYRRLGAHYGVGEEWRFEPRAASAVFDAWLREADIQPLLAQYLDRVDSENNRITQIHLLGGLRVRARVFVDATYEADLLARAGCSYHVGRESNQTFNETLNGIQVKPKHQFGPGEVDPFVRPGDPSSGLLPFIEPRDQSKHQGEGDRRLQAFCFRVCMTNDPALRIDWQKPEAYRDLDYELAIRWHQSEKDNFNEPLMPRQGKPHIRKFDVLSPLTRNGFFKTDTNNHGAVSSDYIGGNWKWPDASYQEREEIFQAHVRWQQGFYWTMANSPRIPERYRDVYRQWGLSRDEFTTTGGWSHTLYVREARRLISDYVLTEADCMHTRQCNDPVGMGSYNLDSHNCTRFVTTGASGKPIVMNDGDVQHPPAAPYSISFRSIVPARSECTNLVVPVCCSTSHIAYGSVRMEPVFMILGQSAAHIADLSIRNESSVQEIRYETLRQRLQDAGQVLTLL